MTINIGESMSVGEIRSEFNAMFPFLRLGFYKPNEAPNGKQLSDSFMLKPVLKNKDQILIDASMSVSELENMLSENFGIEAQVFRKSGKLWLETTMTDNWSLAKQNEHGREISINKEKEMPEEPDVDKM